jgi:hypothetical protein
MKKALFVVLIPLALFCSLPGVLVAQITITSSDIHKPVGYTLTEEGTGPGTFPVDLGTAGGPRNWDFSSYTMSWQSTSVVVDPSTTPFASDFATSNFCYNQSDSEGVDFFQYMRVDPSVWTFQGFGYNWADSGYDVVYNPMMQIPLPVSMGSAWDMEYSWSDTVFGVVSTIAEKSHNSVDAWGTMTVPAGTFDVLRVAIYDTMITTVGMPPFQFSDTTATIEYDWVAREPTFVVEVTSMEGETNPNFTQAASVIRTANPSGIGNDRGGAVIPRAFDLEQNSPNPFNPSTEIRFSVQDGAKGYVDLSVYTIRGRRVKTLASGAMEPGEYTVSWDGRDDEGKSLPSGVYLYRLVAGGRSLTRKMIMAK